MKEKKEAEEKKKQQGETSPGKHCWRYSNCDFTPNIQKSNKQVKWNRSYPTNNRA